LLSLLCYKEAKNSQFKYLIDPKYRELVAYCINCNLLQYQNLPVNSPIEKLLKQLILVRNNFNENEKNENENKNIFLVPNEKFIFEKDWNLSNFIEE
jgi:hypothetical protein